MRVKIEFSLKYSTVLSHPVDCFHPNYAKCDSIHSLPELPPPAIADSVLLPD
ncbi:hypothetical protein Cni_G08659 [Canna indica]|uniref:Uncharacterized protein n=1 Tax=Canna indica TaxID=4628 RepID=A0AAQ3K386_9LILI|nr:hypothetical protein Cni_G08659 [Canna indica]